MIEIYKLLKRGVASTIVISAVAMIIQISCLSFLSRTDKDIVSLIAVIELCIAWFLAFSFFGGEQYFINLVNRGHRIRNVFRTTVISMVCWLPVFIITYCLLQKNGIFSHVISDVSEGVKTLVVVFLATILSVVAAAYRSKVSLLMASISERIFSVMLVILGALISYYATNNAVNIVLNAALLLSSVFVCVLYLSLKKAYFDRESSFEGDDLRRGTFLTKEGLFFTLTMILVVVYEKIDQAVVLSSFGKEELAGYYLCFKLAFAVRFITKSINTASYPILSRLVNMRGVDHVRFTSDIKVLNFLIAIACSLPLVFLSEQVINLFYGEELVAYSLILKFMALALVISSANQVDFNYLNSIGKSKVFFANSVITVFVQIFLIFMLLPIYGVETLVISKFLAVFTGFLIAQYSLYRSGNELHHKLNLVITLIMIYFLAVLERV